MGSCSLSIAVELQCPPPTIILPRCHQGLCCSSNQNWSLGLAVKGRAQPVPFWLPACGGALGVKSSLCSSDITCGCHGDVSHGEGVIGERSRAGMLSSFQPYTKLQMLGECMELQP